jgi:hypothetical protein
MCERRPIALSHEWGSALHGIKVVRKHKKLHDHLASILLLYCAGCITIHIKRLLDVGLSQYRCSSEELLQSEKGFFALRAPFELGFPL